MTMSLKEFELQFEIELLKVENKHLKEAIEEQIEVSRYADDQISEANASLIELKNTNELLVNRHDNFIEEHRRVVALQQVHERKLHEIRMKLDLDIEQLQQYISKSREDSLAEKRKLIINYELLKTKYDLLELKFKTFINQPTINIDRIQ